jgi:hypothetical protein
MRPDTQTHSTSNTTRWAGRVLSGLAVLFLTWDGVIKIVTLAPVVEAFARLGYPVTVAVGIGILELVCVAIYVIPRTSALGAILLTGCSRRRDRHARPRAGPSAHSHLLPDLRQPADLGRTPAA